MSKTALSRSAVLLCAVALLVLAACGGAKAPAHASRTPDREQIAAELDKYAGEIGDFDQVRAILVAVDDRTVFEHYYGTDPDTYWDMESVTKSVVSSLIGMALDEGRIQSLDQHLADLLPQYARQMAPAVAGTTLRQLLTMTGGFPFSFIELTRYRDMVRADPGQSRVAAGRELHLLQRQCAPCLRDPAAGDGDAGAGVRTCPPVRAAGHATRVRRFTAW